MRPERVALDANSYTILLPVGRDVVPEELGRLSTMAQERELSPKAEFHITVAGFSRGKKIKELYAHLAPEGRTAVEQALRQLAEGIDWSFTLDNQSVFYIEKEYNGRGGPETRRSIIVLVSMPGMEEFYKKLNAALKTNFEIPPAHLTLYTGGTNPATAGTGIGLDSQSALDELKSEHIIL